MEIILGKTEVGLLNPPNEGTVKDGSVLWKISRTGNGNIALRQSGECHADLVNGGMDMQTFCQWINSHL